MTKAKRYNCVETNLFGPGSLNLLGEEVKKRGLVRALIVTDRSLVEAGVARRVENVLLNAGISYSVYQDVLPNPTVSIVNSGLEFCQASRADFIVAVGGGSPIDTAKAIGILATNGGSVQQYEGINKSNKQSLPIVAVNTTAGTGSEVTSFYVITDEQRHTKMVIVDNNCIVSIAVNDPELMLSMPKSLTAATGMDALTHAIEAFLSKEASPITDKDALWAIKTIRRYLQTAVDNGDNLEARSMMAYAEYTAGMAFSNAGLGMVHAMAHSLGGIYNLPHGVCNALLLPYVMEYNGADREVQKRFKDIAAALGVKGADWMVPYRAMIEAVADIRRFTKALGIPSKLKDLGVREHDLEALSNMALADTCMPTNPRQPSLQDVISVFRKAYR
ncbi:MAG: iron-containing alcohol dehydrogenase [Bacillota bacterium]